METLAHELYLAHLPHVPVFAKKTFREFIATEEHHRRLFEKLYRKIGGVNDHPRFPVSVFLMKHVARLVRIGGFRAICRFECSIEQRAIRDYTQALQFVKQRHVRTALKQVLRDGRSHPSLEALLQRFQKDEEHHVKTMEQTLRKKISTVTR